MTFQRALKAASPWAFLLALGGCLYGFSGGGGLPSHVETVAVPPVENETSRFVLTEQLTQGLLEAVRSRLGARVAAVSEADAVIRAALRSYSDDAVSVGAREEVGAEVFQRRITIGASIEIQDRVRDEIIWTSGSVRGVGEYAPDEETEDVGIELALENLILKIVDGAQEGW